jgi:thioredoxin reductase (NADPH)
MMQYDLVIIGGGPIGLACGLEAQRKGLSYLILEKGALVNSLHNYPANMSFFSTSDRLEIGNIPFVSINAKPTRSEALEYYRRVTQSYDLNIHLFEQVENVSAGLSGIYEIKTAKNKVYFSRNIVVATGFYDVPFRMNVKGEDLPKVTHYYKEPHFYYRQNVVVVGANNSAADAALETYRKGAKVTMIIRGKEVGQRVKYWARPDLVNRIEEGSINAFYQSSVAEIRAEELDIQTPEGIVTIPNDYVIAMTGYQPNFDFLQKIGIELSFDEKKHPAYNKDTQESNIKGIYLAGVVCGGMDTHLWFIENSRIHAEKIVANISAK